MRRLWMGLVGFALHAQNLAGQVFDLIDRLGDFHPTAFATTTGMNLGFHHPNRAAELLRGFHRLLHREGRDAPGNWHTELTQDLLALVLVNLHEVSLCTGGNTEVLARTQGPLGRRTAVKCIMLRCTNLIFN